MRTEYLDRNKATRFRAARLQAVGNLMDLAISREADLVLCAGDLFEHNGVDRKLVSDFLSTLGSRPGMPVYLLPGNHDPLSADSVYRSDVFQKQPPSNVTLLSRREPLKLESGKGTLYPCPCFQADSYDDPTDWIEAREDSDGIRIGVAHGNWSLVIGDTRSDHPIPTAAATSRQLDYLALGHWHSTFPDPSAPASREGRTFYSGTPEPTRFGERDSGNVLLVEIEDPGARPSVETIRVARLRHQEETIESPSQQTLQELQARLQKVESPEDVLLRVRLTGLTALDSLGPLKDLQLWLEDESSFFHAVLDRTKLLPKPSDEELDQLAPGGFLRATLDRLRRIAAGDTAELPPGWTESWRDQEPDPAAAARRALERFYLRLHAGKEG